MPTSRPVRLAIELQAADQRVSGRSQTSGRAASFGNWLELLTLLEAARLRSLSPDCARPIHNPVHAGGAAPLERKEATNASLHDDPRPSRIRCRKPGSRAGEVKGKQPPVERHELSTTIVDLATGTGSVAGGGRVSQIGRFKFTNDITSFRVTGPDKFSLTLTAIIVAANGDKICTPRPGPGR